MTYNDFVSAQRIERLPSAPIVWIEIDRSDQHFTRARRIVQGLQHYRIQIQNMRIDTAAAAAAAAAIARAIAQTANRFTSDRRRGGCCCCCRCRSRDRANECLTDRREFIPKRQQIAIHNALQLERVRFLQLLLLFALLPRL